MMLLNADLLVMYEIICEMSTNTEETVHQATEEKVEMPNIYKPI